VDRQSHHVFHIFSFQFSLAVKGLRLQNLLSPTVLVNVINVGSNIYTYLNDYTLFTIITVYYMYYILFACLYG